MVTFVACVIIILKWWRFGSVHTDSHTNETSCAMPVSEHPNN